MLQGGLIYHGDYDILQNALTEDKTLYESHRQDCRYKGPLDVAPTVTSSYGTGGLNTPIVNQSEKTYCICATIINRQHWNGANGTGVNEDISYTLTQNDIHAVMKMEKPYQDKIGALCARDYKGISNQYVHQNKCIVEVFAENSYAGYAKGFGTLTASGGSLGGGSESLVVDFRIIRRLVPIECERLQGLPDCWTNVNNATDSKRYKGIGNSIAIPCAEFIFKRLVEQEDKTIKL